MGSFTRDLNYTQLNTFISYNTLSVTLRLSDTTIDFSKNKMVILFAFYSLKHLNFTKLPTYQ